MRLLLLWPVLCVVACGPADQKTKQPVTPSDSDSAATDVPLCADGVPVRAFNPTGPSDSHRHEPAGDFSVPLTDGTTWTLSEHWTGCDSYVFLPHWFGIDDQDSTSWWTTSVEDLIATSPPNVHYFFVVGGRSADDAETYAAMMDGNIAEALASPTASGTDWANRLHVVQGPGNDIEGLVSLMIRSRVGYFGFAVDRAQTIRTLGSMGDVNAYDSALGNAGLWPYEMRLSSAAHEVEYMNFEALRDARMATEDATIVEVLHGDVIAEYTDAVMTLPDAATMANFDSMEVEVLMECPDKDSYEYGNCGAWDYISNFWLMEEDGTALEMARFITSYHRESHWVVDASHALAWLKDGGSKNIRFSWAPSWNTQPTGVTLKVRLFNQGKGVAPQEIVPLFTGGDLNTAYNTRDAIDVPIPADAKKVEVVAIVTGHGMDTNNCAEFCDHEHHFTVNGQTFDYNLDDPGDNDKCAEMSVSGTTPLQWGTWWYGRGGWCPGREVAPFVADVTAQAPAGGTATISYAATRGSRDPIDGEGNISMTSWLVISR